MGSVTAVDGLPHEGLAMKRLLHTLIQKFTGLRSDSVDMPLQPRLRQAHFDMMRAIQYGRGEWISGNLGPWEGWHQTWLGAGTRQRSWDGWHQMHPGRKSASQHAMQTQLSGPDLDACRTLCRDLVARGFAICDEEDDTGAPLYRLTAQGRTLIGHVTRGCCQVAESKTKSRSV
ncbi:hypothetical protein R69746_08403 [Paraburkholderia aspalathi]|nr:hypothetical protein R69746_08403 [Paraburkholderia aspalathi]